MALSESGGTIRRRTANFLNLREYGCSNQTREYAGRSKTYRAKDAPSLARTKDLVILLRSSKILRSRMLFIQIHQLIYIFNV